MSDQPQEETHTESNGDGDETRTSLQRETRATSPVDTFSASNGDRADDASQGKEKAEDVEIEVVLLSNDEEQGDDLPRTLTEHGSAFRWYVPAAGVVAAGVATGLFLKFRAPQQTGKVRAGLNRMGSVAAPLQGLGGAAKGFGSSAGDRKARAQALAAQAQALTTQAQALAAQARALAGKAPPARKKSAWEEARDTAQEVVRDNALTLIALAASTGLTIAGRLADVKREGSLPLPPPPKKAWYQIGPWS